MKYINTNYSLFDSDTFVRYTDTNGSQYLCNGEAKLTLPAENTKLYVSMEIYPTNICTCWPIQIYFSDGTYNSIKVSTVQIYYYYDRKELRLCTNDSERLKTVINGTYRWHKIYLVIDSVAGTIDYYLDGDKVGTYSSYVKTGVKAISCKIKTNNDSSDNYRFRIRNIIISDQYFPINESIIVIPATVANNGFSYDESTGLYSTEKENSTIQATPDLSVLDVYKVTAVNVGMGTTTLGDTIQHIKLDMGTYSKTQEIPATGKGMYFDNLPTSINNITVTAKK